MQRDLPQLALSAELQGIDTSFPKVLLDESCLPLRDTIERVFAQRPDLMGTETPPATVKLDLAPEAWRKQRAALVRRREWRKRLLWAGGAYAAAFLLFALYVAIIRFQVGHLQKAIGRDAPKVEFIKRTEANWKALSPAIDPHYYPIEVLLHFLRASRTRRSGSPFTSNPLKQYFGAGRSALRRPGLSVCREGKETSRPAEFYFQLGTPRILPNDHAQFRLEGKTK